MSIISLKFIESIKALLFLDTDEISKIFVIKSELDKGNTGINVFSTKINDGWSW